MAAFKITAIAASAILIALGPPAWSQEPATPSTQVPAPVQQHAPQSPAGTSENSVPAVTMASANGKIVLPSGTHIPLVLHNAISTRSAQRGDPVYFETTFPIMQNGKIIVPAGSWISGQLTEVKRPGRVKGRAELMMRLNTLILPNAYAVSLIGSPSNAGTGGNETTDREGKVKGDTDKGHDVGTVMTTTAEGAGIGAIAGQSAKGAGIGAGIGAAAGLAAVLFTRGPDAELPRGTTLEAVLDHAVTLDAEKINFTSPGQASSLPGPPNREPQRTRFPF